MVTVARNLLFMKVCSWCYQLDLIVGALTTAVTWKSRSSIEICSTPQPTNISIQVNMLLSSIGEISLLRTELGTSILGLAFGRSNSVVASGGKSRQGSRGSLALCPGCLRLELCGVGTFQPAGLLLEAPTPCRVNQRRPHPFEWNEVVVAAKRWPGGGEVGGK